VNLSPAAFATLTGFVGVALGIVIKDVAVPLVTWLNRTASERKTSVERYAQPFASATESLYWRLDEILVTQRNSYLKKKHRLRPFQSYKFESTIYRCAALLAWMWAIKKEHSLLLERNSDSADAIFRLIEEIVTAFADGIHVETWTVEQLCDLWEIDRPPRLAAAKAGSDIEDLIDAAVAEAGERRKLSTLGMQEQYGLLISVAHRLQQALPTQSEATIGIGEPWSKALEILEVRQAWVFRDWQNAIGELMTKRLEPSAGRLFDVVGFVAFQHLLESEGRWLRPLERVFAEFDPSADVVDFRKGQLRNVHLAVAKTLVRLKSLDLSQKCISPEVALAAQETVDRYRQEEEA
jgi:hypothetical protein